MGDKTDSEHNQDLLVQVFELARDVIHRARGHRYSIASVLYVDEEAIVKAARDGARAGVRDALDCLRGYDEGDNDE